MKALTAETRRSQMEQKGSHMTTTTDEKSGLLRALLVLNLIAEGAPESVGVSRVARELSLPKAVAHRILKEFTTSGYLNFDEETKKYQLGPRALGLGFAAMRTLDVPRIARPHLRRMVDATGETATLSAREGWRRTYIDQVLSPHEVRMSVPVGTSHPLYAGSSSKAILAFLSDEEIDGYLKGRTLEPLTVAALSESALRADLRHVRKVGYALSKGERQADAGSLSAPVYLGNGEIFGAVSLCGPKDRFLSRDLDELAAVVVGSARRISEELGYHPSMEETT